MADAETLRAMVADMRRRDAYKRRTGGDLRLCAAGFEVETLPDERRGDWTFFYEDQAHYYAELAASFPEIEIWQERAETYRRIVEKRRAEGSERRSTDQRGEGGPSHDQGQHDRPQQPEGPPGEGTARAEPDAEAAVAQPGPDASWRRADGTQRPDPGCAGPHRALRRTLR
jgi:hypothetical protein